MNHALVIHCPACAAGYLLPRNLLGPLGARVTCPQCRESFDVDAGGVLAVSASASSRTFAQQPGVNVGERSAAREVLDELAARLGDELAAAAREGRLFREHGRELLGAFDAFRERAGGQADPREFREELRRRWGVDLFPMAEARA